MNSAETYILAGKEKGNGGGGKEGQKEGGRTRFRWISVFETGPREERKGKEKLGRSDNFAPSLRSSSKQELLTLRRSLGSELRRV